MQASIDTLKAQLLQLKQLHKAGALGQAEYDSSKAGLERRLLDLVLAAPSSAGAAPASVPASPVDAVAVSGGAPAPAAVRHSAGNLPPVASVPALPSRRFLALLGVAVLAVAAGGYAWTGSPSLLSASPARAAAAAAEAAGHENAAPSHTVGAEQIAQMTERLAQRLKEQPQDAQGWAMLGRSYSVLGRNDEAVKAYRTAIEQQGDDAALIADFADALAVQNNRVLAGEPMKWVRRALEIDPKNVKALALAGTDAFDSKNFVGAVKLWEKLLEHGPSDAGFAEQVKASIAEARERGGLGPSAQPGAPAQPTAPTMPRANATQVPAGPAANPAQPAPATPGTQAAQAPQATLAASVSGTVSLSAALAAKAGPDDTVFIFARPADGSRMPLAVLRKRVRDLPVRFTLDDSMAMSPAAKLSGSPRVIVAARISKSGEAMSSPGDLVGQVGPVALGSTGLAVEIGSEVKP